MLDLLDRTLVGLVTKQIDNPPAGSNLYWTSPQKTRILVHSIFFRLVTSADVADRRVTIEALHGSIAFSQAPAPGHQVASETLDYRFAPCILGIDESDDLSFMWAPISEHLYLEESHALGTNIINLDNTDQISAVTIRFYQALPR
ncbi:hypothetical protein LCGC14_1151140 [marine sediment metagenome]|uniref:Uncharacterized protein n=1 Tax=marine sediment metagenome TaxID=412755 RepID=A0A0F9M0D2_9ZZZZ